MQETLSERSAPPGANVDRRLAAGDAAGRNNQLETSFVESNGAECVPIKPDRARSDQGRSDQGRFEGAESNAIEKCIAETLLELDADDSEPFELGAVPLDGPDAPRQPLSAQRSNRHRPARRSRRGRSRSDPTCRLILMAMLISALTALGMVSFAATEGFIP